MNTVCPPVVERGQQLPACLLQTCLHRYVVACRGADCLVVVSQLQIQHDVVHQLVPVPFASAFREHIDTVQDCDTWHARLRRDVEHALIRSVAIGHGVTPAHDGFRHL